MEMTADGHHVSVPRAKLFMGVPIHPVTVDELIGILVNWGEGSQLKRVYNVNLHAMNLAHKLEEFSKVIAKRKRIWWDGHLARHS